MRDRAVIGKAVDIPTPDGVMDAYAAHPDGAGKFVLVVLFMDIWGLREELFAIARRIAAHGYYCVVPNLYYREGKIRYERRNAEGKMASYATLPDAVREEMLAHALALNRQTTRIDTGAILDFCRGEPVNDAAAGTVGFCLGGRKVFLAAQEFPDRFVATASLHGTRMVTDAADSPHRMVNRMRGEVYCGFGEVDPYTPPETRAAIAQAFAACDQVTYRCNVHAGVNHGYALPDRDLYDSAAAEADWQEIFAMYARRLVPSD
jgi:carboxymethylenebutenolidase